MSNLNDVINYGTAKFKVVKNLTSEDIKNIGCSNGNGIPIGTIVPYINNGNTPPSCFLFCDGSALSRETYGDLFNVIGTTYGDGDGSTTFNLPDLTNGVFLEGSNTAGVAKAAGVPNIEGSLQWAFQGHCGYTEIAPTTHTGAFDIDTTATPVVGSVAGNPGGNTAYPITFDASESNLIYGASDTVQPKSLTVRYIIKFVASTSESDASAATSASQARAAAQAAESYAGSAGIPVGTLFPFAGDVTTPPTGFLACDGSAVSRTMYPDLFAAIGTTYGPGDGSTTFNLPDEKFLKGIAVSVYGKDNSVMTFKLGASAPARSGSFYNVFKNTYGIADSQSATSGSGFNFPSSSDSVDSNVYTDLSDAASSDIHYIIKAYDGVIQTNAWIDISQYASDLSNKADRSLSNLNATGEARFAHVVVDSYYDSATGDWWREYADGWIEQGGEVATTDNQTVTVNLLKAMADDKYMVLTSRRYSLGGVYLPCVQTKTTTTVTILGYTAYSIWYVAGMGASV